MVECDLFNLHECLIKAFIDFILSIFNAPIKVLINGIKLLLTTSPNNELFFGLWALFVYVLSTFYGVFVIFAGLNFIISSASPEKRMMAKEWLQNVILLILCVQSSYLIYTLVSNVASSLSKGVLSLVDKNFFLFTLDSLVNSGLQIIFGFLYLVVLVCTLVILAVVYFVSSIGVVLFPFGLFFYFIPPLKDVGRFIISVLFFVLFLPFFIGLILLATSKLVLLPVFSSIKILLVIASFVLVNSMILLVVLLAVLRSAVKVVNFSTKPFSSITRMLSPKSEKRDSFGEKERYFRGR